MENFNFFISILFSDLLIICLFFALKKQKKNQITKCFYCILLLMFIWTFSLTLQLFFQKNNDNGKKYFLLLCKSASPCDIINFNQPGKRRERA